MVPGQARDLFTLTLIFADSKKLRHCPGLAILFDSKEIFYCQMT